MSKRNYKPVMGGSQNDPRRAGTARKGTQVKARPGANKKPVYSSKAGKAATAAGKPGGRMSPNVRSTRISAAIFAALALAAAGYWLAASKGNLSPLETGVVVGLILVGGISTFIALRAEEVLRRMPRR
jgi:hypothetical protein